MVRDLAENFRSRPEVLEFVNAVFRRIMTEGTASMRYDKQAELKAEFKYPLTAAGERTHPVELILLDQDVDDSLPDQNSEDTQQTEDNDDTNADISPELIEATQRQAALIAQRIRQMSHADSGKAEFQIYDRKLQCCRDVRYGDIVILMRSLSYKVNTYVEVLCLAQIPVDAQGSAGYFETTEISDCMNLLKTLDNPNGDIELAATLRSPLFGFNDNELAEICLFAKTKGLPKHRSITRCRFTSKRGRMPLCDKRWRKRSGSWNDGVNRPQRGSLATLLDGIFRETGLVSFYAALPNGSVRQANLVKLHDRAIQFEGFRPPGREWG